MKQNIIFISIIALALSSQIVIAESISDTYTSGDTLTAAKMEKIKTAVNDNDTNISTLDARVTQNESDIGLLSGITSYLSIPARGGFQPVENEDSFASCFPTTFSWNGTGSSLFAAMVTLPHNATITGFTYYFWRGGPTLETTATLYRQGMPATSRQSIGAYTSTVSDNGHTSGDAIIDVTRNTVDNQNYTYYIEVDLPEISSLCTDGAKITYTTP